MDALSDGVHENSSIEGGGLNDNKINITIFTFKLNIDDLLSLDNIKNLKIYFVSLGYSDFYDFYFTSTKKFVEMIFDMDDLNIFFKNAIKNKKLFDSEIRKKHILLFANYLGYHEPLISDVRNEIRQKLYDYGISSFNEFEVFQIKDFKVLFNGDNSIRYFCFEKLGKSYYHINFEDYKKLGKKLGFKYLEKDEFSLKLKEKLSSKGINYIDDLDNLSVEQFRDFMCSDLLFSSYILLNHLDRNMLGNPDKIRFGNFVGLTNSPKKHTVKFLLKKYRINSYSDLEKMGHEGARSFLWGEPLFREKLNILGLEYAKDFRFEHILKFSRYVGLDGIPKVIEYSEDNIKKIIISHLLSHGISCRYGLRLKGIKYFKRIFTTNTIGLNYEYVNLFIKTKTGNTINKLGFSDLDTIGKTLGLPELLYEEHKEKFLQFLSSRGETLETLNKSKISNKVFWNNTNLRYFIGKLNLGDNYKAISPDDINKLKSI